MFLDQQIPEQCKSLWQECQRQSRIFLDGASASSTDVTIPSNSMLDCTDEFVYLIKDGIINESHSGRVIMNYEDGDLLGADCIFASKDSEFHMDFAVIVDKYNKQALLDHIYIHPERVNAWCTYLSCLSQSYQLLSAHFNKQDVAFHPQIREYSKGDILIQEGASDSEVFTLLSGTAQAMIGDTVVGEINTDEIFGAIAALTGTKRTASIVATSDCTALVVQSDRFRGLIAVRPDTVLKLIEDMARTIVSCNEKIVDLTSNKQCDI